MYFSNRFSQVFGWKPKPQRRQVRDRRRFRRFETLEKRNLLATYVVDSLTDDGSGTTLREALEAASTNEALHGLPAGESNDIIRFSEALFRDGPATLTLRPDLHPERIPGALYALGQGGQERTAGVSQKSISIVGPGPERFTIDAGGAESIFVVEDIIDVSGMRITGSTGRAIRSGGAFDLTLENVLIDGNAGGGVELTQGVLTVKYSTIENNGFLGDETIAEAGGAIDVTASVEGRLPTLVVEDSLIRGNQAHRGGGISVDRATVVVNRSTIVGNTAVGDVIGTSSGGGIYVVQSEFSLANASLVSVYESEIANNDAVLGGGIYVAGAGQVVQVRDSVLDGNTASESGGGVHVFTGFNAGVAAQLIVSGSTVSSNQAPIGAGIDNVGGTIEISNSTFFDNEASQNGGAISSRRVTSPVASDGPATTLNNTTISGNRAAGFGAGIFHDPQSGSINDPKLRLINTTITLNDSLAGGGGLAVNEVVGLPTAKLVNTIVAGNTSVAAPSDIFLMSAAPILVNESRFNLIGDPASAGGLLDDRDGSLGTGNIVGDLLGQPINIDQILFRNLADNLGNAPLSPLFGTNKRIKAPAVHSLKLDSPALDAGTPFLPSASEGILFDEAGAPIIPTLRYEDALQSDARSYPFLRADSSIGDSGFVLGRIDIGAYENQFRPVFTNHELVVSTLVDEDDGDYSFGDLSLREAVKIANLSPNANGIRFASSLIETDEGIISTIFLTTPIEIVFDLVLSGPGSDLLQISGSNQTRMIEVGPLANTFISGLALVDGVGEGSIANFDGFDLRTQGGALFSAGNTTIQDVLFANNTSRYSGDDFNAAFAGGGAIANVGSMTIKDSVLRDNHSEAMGGAIVNLLFDSRDFRYSVQDNELHIGPNVLLENNEAEIDGGAIYTRVPLTIEDSKLSGNIALNNGGAISTAIDNVLSNTGTPRQTTLIRRSELSGNRSGKHGGAIIDLNPNSTVEVIDSTISGNRAGSATASGNIRGGGIYASGGLHVERTTISGNTAESSDLGIGGGIALRSGGSVNKILSSTISGNIARGKNATGGGFHTFELQGIIQNFDSTLIIDSTIANNRVIGNTNSSFVEGSGLTIADRIELSNSIVSANTQQIGSGAVTVGEQVSLFFTVTAKQPNVITNISTQQLTRIVGATTYKDDPNLSSLADNGGRSETQAIGATSIAIDNGERLGLLDQRGFPVTDQAGSIFDLRDDDGKVGDIGAFESSQVTVVPFTAEIRGASQFGAGSAAVFGQGFDDGLPNSTISKEPGFLGIEFDQSFTVGPGVYEDPFFGTQWGGDATVDFDGRLGLEYGYYVNSGSVDTFYDGSFAYSLNEVGNGVFVIGTGSVLTDGSVYTVSPRVGAFVDLVFEFNANIGGRACVVSCAQGNIPISIDETVPLFSINRQEEDDAGNLQFVRPDGTLTSDSNNGNNPPAFDGDINLALIDYINLISSGYSKAKKLVNSLGDAREKTRKAEIDKAEGKAGDHDKTIREGKAEEQAATTKDPGAKQSSGGAGLTVSFGQSEDLLGVEVELGIGTKTPKIGKLGSVGISKSLGKLALTVPEIQLSDQSFDNEQGTLSASTDDFGLGSALDAKRQIAALSVDVGALGPFGVYEFSAGPIDVEATTVSYVITPRLALSQDIKVEPFFDAQHQAGFDFTFAGGGTIDVFVGSTATALKVNTGDSISFMPGTEIRVDAGTKIVNIAPSMTVGNRFSNDIGLDIDLQGMLEILRLKLNAFSQEIFDLGPVYENTHTLIDSFDLGSIFSSTFNLPATKTRLAAFTLGVNGAGSRRDGASPGGAFLMQSGTTARVEPLNNQTTYFTIPLVGPDGVIHQDVLFETTGNEIVQIRPPYGGTTLELLDGDGRVQSSFELDVAGTTFANGLGPQTFRLRGFENLLGSAATFGVKFASETTRDITVTVAGAEAPGAIGVHTERLLTDARQAAFESAANIFVRQFDLALDIDGDGFLSPTTDGTLIARFIEGKSGDALIAGITSADVISDTATRTNAAEILAYLQGLRVKGRLDVDDDASVTLNDAVLILRHFSGIGGSSTTQQGLTDGLTFAPGAKRTLPADIRAFIDGGQSPTLNSTFADGVLSLSDRSGIPTFRVSSSAVTGSSPFAPVLTPFVDGTGVFALSTFGENVIFDETFLVDKDDPSIRTLVRSRADGTPGRTIDLPDEFRKYLGDPLSPEIDVLVGRFENAERTPVLGTDEPLFVRVPNAEGFEFTLPAGVSVSELHFDPNVGGNIFYQHTEANSGTTIDFDLHIPATGEWFEISMSEPFTLPVGVSTFELYPRPIVTPRILDPRDGADADLDLTVGLVLRGPVAPAPDLTVKVLADRQQLSDLNEIQIGVGSDATSFETRIARDGAFLEVSTHGVQTPLSSQDISLNVEVTNDYPAQVLKGLTSGTRLAWEFYFMEPGVYQVSASWDADESLSSGVIYTTTHSIPDSTSIAVDQRREAKPDAVIDGINYQDLFETRVIDGFLSVQIDRFGFDGLFSAKGLHIQRVDQTANVAVVDNPAMGIPFGLSTQYDREFAGRSSVTVNATGLRGGTTTDTYSVTIPNEPFQLVDIRGIVDLIVLSGTTQHTIDVSKVLDATGLTLSVESNNPAVTGSITSDVLTIDFAKDASAKLVITARDASGMLVGTDTFFVTTGIPDLSSPIVLDPVPDQILQWKNPRLFEFNGRLRDSFGGVSLTSSDIGVFINGGYVFEPGQGLSLYAGITNPREYAIEMTFELGDRTNFQKLLDFKDLTLNTGLYNIDDVIYFYRENASDVDSNIKIQRGRQYNLLFTRVDATSEVQMLIDGELAFSFIDSNDQAVLSEANAVVHFFKDDNQISGDVASGIVTEIRIDNSPVVETPAEPIFSTRYTDRTAFTYASLFADTTFSLPNETRTDQFLKLTGKAGADDTLILDARTGPLYQPFSFHAEFGNTAPTGGWTDRIEVQGKGTHVDLRESDIQGIGVIDLRGEGANTLTATAKALFDNDPTGNPLLVIADADDSVIRSDNTVWTKLSAQQTDPVSGFAFDIYTSEYVVPGEPTRIQTVTLWVSDPTSTTAVATPVAGPEFTFPTSTLSVELVNKLKAPGQIVLLPPSDANLTAGEKFTVDVLYNVDDANGLIPPALLVEVHYDSSRIRFTDLPFVLADGLVNDIDSESPEFETVDDGNLRTDRTMILSFTDFLGAWPAGATSSTKLATIEFQASDATAISEIRLTGLSSNGFVFDAEDFALLSIDAEPPTLVVPTPVVFEGDAAGGARSSAGAVAALFATAMTTDEVDRNPTLTNDAPATIPVGDTPITFTAMDLAGNMTSSTITITVVDTTAPALTVPADLTVSPTASGSMLSRITAFLNGATATDIVDATPAIQTNAPATFSAGTTSIVSFTAVDAAGNQTILSAEVTVTDVFVVDAEGQTISLAQNNAQDPGIRRFDLRGLGNNTLMLDADVIGRVFANGRIDVISDPGDVIEFDDDWEFDAVEIVNGLLVRRFSNNGATINLFGPDDFSNPLNPFDVNSDGVVTAVDALQVINELNNPRFATGGTNGTNGFPDIDQLDLSKFSFLDVSRDRLVTALDALQIINELNRSSGQGEDVTVPSQMLPPIGIHRAVDLVQFDDQTLRRLSSVDPSDRQQTPPTKFSKLSSPGFTIPTIQRIETSEPMVSMTDRDEELLPMSRSIIDQIMTDFELLHATD
ncbi:choice-of-anchor Q domain-containing protein [Neorhodopirellula pilleata]|uniref:Dockerin type I repeat protein n=1 Tax=Neorhodopirellula pilleata TaxID=2714738 RepID=A0A5C6A410_9BACT|nr:choice-of-anchor Q domain-containing protein [Neorhodopirellula pilleata]TWT94146.1 hypothetical protein Pla100_37540 [Neorhodopirellula pilleata]